MFPNLHDASIQVLNSKTYVPYNFPSKTQIEIIKGTDRAERILNPVYEISYKAVPISNNIVNVYNRTGADGYQQLSGYGEVIYRSFDVINLRFNNDRTLIYSDPDWAVFEVQAQVINGSIYLFNLERLRSDLSQFRNTILKSTDGLIGKTFTPPIIQSYTDYLIPSEAIPDGNNDYWIYYGCESPSGLYRAKLNLSDCTTTLYSRVKAITMSECSLAVANVPNRIICVYRINSGNRTLKMLISYDYGATWNIEIDTGLGEVAGTKVRPKITQSKDPEKFIVSFADRTTSCTETVTSLNIKANAFNNSWRSVFKLTNNPQTNGNGSVYLIDQQKGLYLHLACGGTSNNAPNELNWWVYKDGTNVSPRPWV